VHGMASVTHKQAAPWRHTGSGGVHGGTGERDNKERRQSEAEGDAWPAAAGLKRHESRQSVNGRVSGVRQREREGDESGIGGECHDMAAGKRFAS
jgi:hypothetical protein